MEEIWTVVQCYLMQEILDELDECEGRMTELLIYSALDENETNSPVNIMHQESIEKVVYLCRTRKGTIRSMMLIDKINDMKMKLGGNFTLRKTGKARVDSKLPAKTAISAKRKRVEDAIDMV